MPGESYDRRHTSVRSPPFDDFPYGFIQGLDGIRFRYHAPLNLYELNCDVIGSFKFSFDKLAFTRLLVI